MILEASLALSHQPFPLLSVACRIRVGAPHRIRFVKSTTSAKRRIWKVESLGLTVSLFIYWR